MTTTTTQLDTLMESASQSLAEMAYFACERHCLKALAVARAEQDWAYYARVLLPLQEARRQRRMIAADGVIRLGSAKLTGDSVEWINDIQVGCIALTHSHTAETAQNLARLAHEQNRYIEVLFADNPMSDSDWTLRSFAGPDVRCTVSAPPPGWHDQWFEPGSPVTKDAPSATQPVDWFLDACEALGDAALASVTAPLGDPQRVIELERCLEVVTDHEILHQALGDAARAL